jgi:hypothetical protein
VRTSSNRSFSKAEMWTGWLPPFYFWEENSVYTGILKWISDVKINFFWWYDISVIMEERASWGKGGELIRLFKTTHLIKFKESSNWAQIFSYQWYRKILVQIGPFLDFFLRNLQLFNPCEHIKKVPPRHQSQNCGSTLNVVHRKLKAVGILILSA